MNMGDGGAGGRRLQAGFRDLGRRDRQVRCLIRGRQVASDGDGDEDAGQGLAHRGPHKDRPPSRTMVVPVENCRDIAQARIALATSRALPTRPNGVEAAILALKSGPRPGTKPVSTAPGATARTRTSGARTRASDLVIT